MIEPDLGFDRAVLRLVRESEPKALANSLHGTVLWEDVGATWTRGVTVRSPPRRRRNRNTSRDRMEIGLLGETLDRDLPVLSICRGIQLLNVYHGGTLIQHLAGDPHRTKESPADPSKPTHKISVVPETRLAAILGDGQHAVNSRHHQAVDRLGTHVRVSATSVDDGIVEGLERPDKTFAVAVQWHPEDQIRNDATQLKLFRALAEAAEKRVVV